MLCAQPERAESGANLLTPPGSLSPPSFPASDLVLLQRARCQVPSPLPCLSPQRPPVPRDSFTSAGLARGSDQRRPSRSPICTMQRGELGTQRAWGQAWGRAGAQSVLRKPSYTSGASAQHCRDGLKAQGSADVTSLSSAPLQGTPPRDTPFIQELRPCEGSDYLPGVSHTQSLVHGGVPGVFVAGRKETGRGWGLCLRRGSLAEVWETGKSQGSRKNKELSKEKGWCGPVEPARRGDWPGRKGGWAPAGPAAGVQGRQWGLGERRGPVKGLLLGTPALTQLLRLLPGPWFAPGLSRPWG